uniref:Reverse transcriptase domain-containing protein n=1 Tax=Lactuca sativa TaxID=4236 RepID=A0A9R1X2K3_LACSA|nr:hypothetical protein LSAT_V11C700355000 [Lactuca sativa]
MCGRLTSEGIHLLRRIMEKYRERNRNLHMVFIALENVYDNIPCKAIWRSLESRRVLGKYIMSTTCVMNHVGDTVVPVEMGIQYGSTISPYIFALILDEMSKRLVPWCVLFANDIVLVVESKIGLIFECPVGHLEVEVGR